MNHAVPELSAPPGAAAYSGTGAVTTAAQLAQADMHSRLRERYSPPFHMERFSVPVGTGWDAITTYYARALGPDWKVDARYAEDGGPGYRSKVWSDGQRAVAIALVPAREPGGEQVLTVFTPEAQG
jgi:hypothetical protein